VTKVQSTDQTEWRLKVAAPLLLLLLSASAQAQSCHQDNPLRSTGTLNLRIDNDMFGGIGQTKGTPTGFSPVGFPPTSWTIAMTLVYRVSSVG
jgi:lipid A 3-O-deacylase